MSEKLLREYVRLALSESPLARVPTQLIDPDGEDEDVNPRVTDVGDDCDCDDCKAGKDCPCDDDELDEFSAVGGGGIAGYTGGFGINPDKLGRKKNAPKKKKK
mgnify:CR=1 FL=1